MAYWVSEPDTGIYNAMNKGIRKAKGEYCLFLNSGDWLISLDSLEKAFEIIMNLDIADVYYGDCIRSDNSLWKMPNALSIDFIIFTSLSHQNSFIKRSLFFEHEFYDENFRTISDTIFFIKEFWLHHSKFIYINTIVSVFSVGGISGSYQFMLKELHEQARNILGDSEFNILLNRNTLHEKKRKKNILIKIIKYLLPYGIVRFIQKYILTTLRKKFEKN
jgi:glycosyltransferase involved in cell wall biosynthesis